MRRGYGRLPARAFPRLVVAGGVLRSATGPTTSMPAATSTNGISQTSSLVSGPYASRIGMNHGVERLREWEPGQRRYRPGHQSAQGPTSTAQFPRKWTRAPTAHSGKVQAFASRRTWKTSPLGRRWPNRRGFRPGSQRGHDGGPPTLRCNWRPHGDRDPEGFLNRRRARDAGVRARGCRKVRADHQPGVDGLREGPRAGSRVQVAEFLHEKTQRPAGEWGRVAAHGQAGRRTLTGGEPMGLAFAGGLTGLPSSRRGGRPPGNSMGADYGRGEAARSVNQGD